MSIIKQYSIPVTADSILVSSGISFDFSPLWASDYANKFAQSCRTVPKNQKIHPRDFFKLSFLPSQVF